MYFKRQTETFLEFAKLVFYFLFRIFILGILIFIRMKCLRREYFKGSGGHLRAFFLGVSIRVKSSGVVNKKGVLLLLLFTLKIQTYLKKH